MDICWEENWSNVRIREILVNNSNRNVPFHVNLVKIQVLENIFFDKLYLNINWIERTENIKDGWWMTDSTRADLDITRAIRWRLHCIFKRHTSNYFTLLRSDIATWATPLDPRLFNVLNSLSQVTSMYQDLNQYKNFLILEKTLGDIVMVN